LPLSLRVLRSVERGFTEFVSFSSCPPPSSLILSRYPKAFISLFLQPFLLKSSCPKVVCGGVPPPLVQFQAQDSRPCVVRLFPTLPGLASSAGGVRVSSEPLVSPMPPPWAISKFPATDEVGYGLPQPMHLPKGDVYLANRSLGASTSPRQLSSARGLRFLCYRRGSHLED
jgi:hypothetical protein